MYFFGFLSDFFLISQCNSLDFSVFFLDFSVIFFGFGIRSSAAMFVFCKVTSAGFQLYWRDSQKLLQTFNLMPDKSGAFSKRQISLSNIDQWERT